MCSFHQKQQRRGFKSGTAECWVWIPAHHLLAITSWPGCLNSVSLSFLIYKMGYDNQTYLRDLLWEKACKAQCLSDDIGSHSSCFLQSSSWINTFKNITKQKPLWLPTAYTIRAKYLGLGDRPALSHHCVPFPATCPRPFMLQPPGTSHCFSK